MFSQGQAAVLYNVARKWLTILSFVLFPIMLNIDLARFISLGNDVLFTSGPAVSIALELTAPILFVYTFLASPLSFSVQSGPPLRTPQIILAALYLAHFIHRVSLHFRTPCILKSHTLVNISTAVFHTANGWVIGAYLTSPFARIYLTADYTFQRPSFYVGVALWVLGIAGKIFHVEILLRLRRRANDRVEDHGDGWHAQERPVIPHGGLYRYISYPQYLCEWLERLGFALAAAPLPPRSVASVPHSFSIRSVATLITNPAYLFAQNLAPPYVLLLAEVLFMLPHAYRDHQWYKRRFGERYPRDRRAVIPFLM